MSIHHTYRAMHTEKDIRYILFNSYMAIIVVLGIVFAGINAWNQRPVENILTGIVISIFSLVLYIASKRYGKFAFARIVFLSVITFLYIPFGYWTSPGSQSAVIYIFIFSVFVLSFIAVKTWEFIFPILVVVETVFLLYTEIMFPDHYYQYTDISYRIFDLSINFTVTTIAIILTLAYVTRRFNTHSDEMYRVSVTDGLTGLYNRRFFTDFIRAEYNRATRTNEPFSMVILDLNNFKRINDEYGHPVGDQVLKDIASILTDNIRDYDIATRAGGDEFVLILPATDKEKAALMVERISKDLNAYCRAYSVVELSVAFGIEDSRDKSIEELYRISDQKLYAMKSHQKHDLTHQKHDLTHK